MNVFLTNLVDFWISFPTCNYKYVCWNAQVFVQGHKYSLIDLSIICIVCSYVISIWCYIYLVQNLYRVRYPPFTDTNVKIARFLLVPKEKTGSNYMAFIMWTIVTTVILAGVLHVSLQ